jgi:hypothetical protein
VSGVIGTEVPLQFAAFGAEADAPAKVERSANAAKKRIERIVRRDCKTSALQR